ncbi:MAG: hypothetical protein ACRDP6_14810 [Actinoallomurus sp.]
MAICDPCGDAADTDQRAIANHHLSAIGHDAAICRDHGLKPNGCGCQHRPASAASPKETDRG